MKKHDGKIPQWEIVKEFYKPGTNAEPPTFERVRVKCPACGWDRILRLRPNQSEVECVCGHRLRRDELDSHTMPLPDHLDAADRHMESYDREPDDG